MSSDLVQKRESDGATSLEQTEIHDVLRNDRRRLVLNRLRQQDGTNTVRELSEYIAGIESNQTPPPRNIRQSVYVSLHQTHLPKLDSIGIVSYDSNAKTVTLAQHADEVTVYLEVVPKYGLSWGEYYLGLGLLGFLVLVAGWIGVPVVQNIGSTALGSTFFLLIVVSAVFQISTQQSTFYHRLRDR